MKIQINAASRLKATETLADVDLTGGKAAQLAKKSGTDQDFATALGSGSWSIYYVSISVAGQGRKIVFVASSGIGKGPKNGEAATFNGKRGRIVGFATVKDGKLSRKYGDERWTGPFYMAK